VFTIRPFVPADYQALVDIQNALMPDRPAVLEDYVEGDRALDPQYAYHRFVAEVDGRVVGVAYYAQPAWMFSPGRYRVLVRVLPDFQRRGIGSALYDRVMEALQPYNPATLWANGEENLPEGLRFLEKRGFTERLRFSESVLDVATFDPGPYADLEARLQREGIDFRSVGELRADPVTALDLHRRLYDLDWDVTQDEPYAEAISQIPFEEWERDVLLSETSLPEGYLVAVDRATGELAGMTVLFADRASTMLYTGLTGVRRGYRRRGIATALKVRSIRYAQSIGASCIRTDNVIENAPMRAINIKLGYIKQPDQIEFEKRLRPDDEAPSPVSG